MRLDLSQRITQLLEPDVFPEELGIKAQTGNDDVLQLTTMGYVIKMAGPGRNSHASGPSEEMFISVSVRSAFDSSMSTKAPPAQERNTGGGILRLRRTVLDIA